LVGIQTTLGNLKIITNYSTIFALSDNKLTILREKVHPGLGGQNSNHSRKSEKIVGVQSRNLQASPTLAPPTLSRAARAALDHESCTQLLRSNIPQTELDATLDTYELQAVSDKQGHGASIGEDRGLLKTTILFYL
jgi:hypothetical protein